MAKKQKTLPTGGSIKEPYNSLITHHEINRVSARKQTVPGANEIHCGMLVHLSEPALEARFQFFNKILIHGKVPEAWKKVIIIPFLKPGKPPWQF